MKIRYGTQTDIKKISHYVKNIWIDHADKEPVYIDRTILENTDPETVYSPIDSKNSILLIAEDTDTLVGFLKMEIQDLQPFFRSKKALYLENIYVIEKYRKQGVAALLLLEAEKVAKKRGITLIKTRAYHFNTAAEGVLRSNGYKPLYSEHFKMVE